MITALTPALAGAQDTGGRAAAWGMLWMTGVGEMSTATPPPPQVERWIAMWRAAI